MFLAPLLMVYIFCNVFVLYVQDSQCYLCLYSLTLNKICLMSYYKSIFNVNDYIARGPWVAHIRMECSCETHVKCSCKTQPVVRIQELASHLSKGIQEDILLLYFPKCFTKPRTPGCYTRWNTMGYGIRQIYAWMNYSRLS